MQCIALGVPVILRYRTSRGKERAGLQLPIAGVHWIAPPSGTSLVTSPLPPALPARATVSTAV